MAPVEQVLRGGGVPQVSFGTGEIFAVSSLEAVEVDLQPPVPRPGDHQVSGRKHSLRLAGSRSGRRGMRGLAC